jgi:hypothetical protein
MMALHEEEEQEIAASLIVPDKLCKNQIAVTFLSPQEQEEHQEEPHRVDVAARNGSLRNPSPPPTHQGKGLNNLSFLLSNLEESWTTMKPHLVKNEPMEEDELVIPELPSLTHLRQPQTTDQLEQSMATTSSKVKTTTMIIEDALVVSSEASHRIGH